MSASARNLLAPSQAVLPIVPNEPRALVALKDEEPERREVFFKLLRNALGPVLCKVAPSLSDDAAVRWKAAVAEALSNLPAELVITATQVALYEPLRLEPRSKDGQPRYRPIQRPGEIETLIRQQAEIVRRRSVVRPQLLPRSPETVGPPPEPPATQADVDEMNQLSRHFSIKREWRLSADQRLEPILTSAEIRLRENQCARSNRRD